MNNILKLLKQRPIAYYPIYRKITGSTNAGIFLSQLMYWFSKKDEIYKTDNEIIKETSLTIDELRGVKKKIKNLTFIEVKRKGIPAKTYYKIDWDLYQTCLGKFPKQDKSKLDNRVMVKSLNSDREKAQTIIEIKDKEYTETTTKTTTEKEKEKDLELKFKLLIDELQTKAPRKSLIKFSLKTEKIFLKLDENWQVIRDNYLLHQTKEQKYSKRFDNFILDYEACVSDLVNMPKPKTNKNSSNTQNAIDRVFADNVSDEAFNQIAFFNAEVI
jgi:hypothetical protein